MMREPAQLVAELLGKCTFPPAPRRLHCAVSGGADSTALAVLAVEAGCVVVVHHVDHGLRDGSAAEAEMVAALADQIGAEFVSHRVEVEPGPNLEARARDARFAVMPDDVATGHTLDDRAETVLINLMRGAARTGLSPLTNPARHPIVRLRRADTEALCEALNMDVVHDPSNQDPLFVRNRVRHELLPLLNDISSRDVAALLDRQADVLGDEDDFLDSLAGDIDASDAKALAAAPAVLARRAMRNFIINEWPRPHPPSVDTVERALEVARGTATSCDLEGGHRIHRTNQKLRLEPPLDSLTNS